MTITMTWNAQNAKTWDGILKTASVPVALQQAYAYGAVFETYGSTPHHAIIHQNGQPVAACQFLQHRLFKFFPLMVAFKGPVWLVPLSPTDKTTILHYIKKNLPVKRHLFALESNLNAPEKNIAEQADYRCVITGASTVWIDLTQSEEYLRAHLEGKWRNTLVKAERSDLTIKKLGKKPSDYQWLTDNERKQRKRRGYWALPDHFIPHFVEQSSQSQPIVTLAAMMGTEKVAGMLFLLHGNSATYHIGWAGDLGRKYNAHNLILWQGMMELKKRGVTYLDLGGINHKDIPGLTRFKRGSGGMITPYAGTFMPKIFG